MGGGGSFALADAGSGRDVVVDSKIAAVVVAVDMDCSKKLRRDVAERDDDVIL